MNRTVKIVIPDIATAMREKVDAKRKLYPCYVNRASEIGHPCVRYLVHKRLDWKQANKPSIKTQHIFSEGNLHEDDVVSRINAAGYQIILQQQNFTWDTYQISGHIDGKILVSDEVSIPFEIKGLNPYTWNKLNTQEDFLTAAAWTIKYYAQLNLYMIMDNKEDGLWLLKNKLTGEIKQVNCKLDYAYTEEIIKKAELVNDFCEKKEYPDPMKYTNFWCKECTFLHLCTPDMDFDLGFELLDKKELQEKLERRDELLEASKEFKKLDGELKEDLKGKENVILGDFVIAGKEVSKKEYTVKAMTYWKCDIGRISEGESEDDE